MPTNLAPWSRPRRPLCPRASVDIGVAPTIDSKAPLRNSPQVEVGSGNSLGSGYCSECLDLGSLSSMLTLPTTFTMTWVWVQQELISPSTVARSPAPREGLAEEPQGVPEVQPGRERRAEPLANTVEDPQRDRLFLRSPPPGGVGPGPIHPATQGRGTQTLRTLPRGKGLCPKEPAPPPPLA